jgi:hypothetical protein
LQCGWVFVPQTKDVFDDGDFSGSGVLTAESDPVVGCQTRRYHVTAAVDCACLDSGRHQNEISGHKQTKSCSFTFAHNKQLEKGLNS